MMRGASGDECGNLLGGKNTIGRTAAALKKPHKRPLTRFLSINKLLKTDCATCSCRQLSLTQTDRHRAIRGRTHKTGDSVKTDNFHLMAEL